MTQNNEIAQHSYTDLNDKELAATLASSGYFDDSKKTQAMTKVLAGREMGFGPVTSLKNIHFVDGGIEIGGQLIASKIRQSEKYDYVIDKHTDEKCTVIVTDHDGNEIGSVTWDIDRAKQAGLTDKHNWKSYPRNMLFNRAISDARRFYCPDVMDVGPYTPGEIPTNGSEQRAVESVEQPDVDEEDYEVNDNGDSEAGDGEDETIEDDSNKPEVAEKLEKMSTLRKELGLDKDVLLRTFQEYHDVDLTDCDIDEIKEQWVEDIVDVFSRAVADQDEVKIEDGVIVNDSIIPF